MASATILTYHRIVARGARERFHDIETTAFEEHLRRIVERRASGDRAATAARRESGPVYISFDDGTADHRHVAELLSSYGLAGIFFVITGRLGRPGYLSEADVLRISAQGHCIGSHSVTHRHLTALSAPETDDELVTSRRQLEAISGQTIEWFAPPAGLCSRALADRASQVGYKVVRTMNWGYAQLPLRGPVPCLPVMAHYDLTAFDRLLDGRAPIWLYSTKNLVKRAVGPEGYARLRDFGGRIITR